MPISNAEDKKLWRLAEKRVATALPSHTWDDVRDAYHIIRVRHLGEIKERKLAEKV